MDHTETTTLISDYSPCADVHEPQVEQSRGFVLSPQAGLGMLDAPTIRESLTELYTGADPTNSNDLMIRSFKASKLLKTATLGPELEGQLQSRFESLVGSSRADLWVRQQTRSVLDKATRVHTFEELTRAIHKIYLEHFSNGIVGLYDEPTLKPTSRLPSIVVQRACTTLRSGVALSLDLKSGAQNFILVYSAWGLAEDVLRRTVARDEFYFHKVALESRTSCLFSHSGEKEFQLLYDPGSQRLEHLPLSREKGRRSSLLEHEALLLARWTQAAESSLGYPVTVTWCATQDQLLVLSVQKLEAPEPPTLKFFTQASPAPSLLLGRAVSHAMGSGKVRVIRKPEDLEDFQCGEILVAERTEPDWEPAFRRANGIITALDRRSSHAAILAREMGIPALLDAQDCWKVLQTGQQVTISCCEGELGRVLPGDVPHDVKEFSLQSMPQSKTQIMVNLSMPERALSVAQMPWAGAGLIRSEFMIGGWVKIHPLALLYPGQLDAETQSAVQRLCNKFDNGRDYFLTKMSQAIALFCGAFWPRPVTLRLSDFKSNEYARLLGGRFFEPEEECAMLGWRGAGRYLHPDYRDAFQLELAAIKRVRTELGLTNLKIMIPFCRTPEEGEEVLLELEKAGLKRNEDGLEVWTMAELPSNVLLAQEFAELFDGMSIGSSDLTSLVLGVARNAEKISASFDEMHPVMVGAYEAIVKAAHEAGKPVSFCGQIASEDSEFAAFLVEMGVDILSVTPDALHPTLQRLGG